MENGAVLIACDTAPGLSGRAIQGLPVVWVRSMALMTAVTLATSYDGWQEYVDRPVVRDPRSGRELPSREVPPRIFVRPSAELDAFLSAARGPLPGPLEALQSDGGSVPVGPLVSFIERDLIAVRSMTYRNPATILAFVGGIVATLVTKLDALVDPRGYRDAVRASHRQKVLEAGAAGRKAEIESVLNMPRETYIDRRVAEGATVPEIVEELERVAQAARRHDEDIELARDLVTLSLIDSPPEQDLAPTEWIRPWLTSTPERAVATTVVRTETDAFALQGLASLDTTVEALPDVRDGMFAPPE